MAKESTTTLSEDSLAYLEESKKGKTRKFAMICKGVNIVSLVLYKKGSTEKYKKEAKTQGKGQFYHGVIAGRGMELRFQLARFDGFEAPPTKNSQLKHFLEEGGFKCKPEFEIVDKLAAVLDESDPLVQRYLALKKEADEISLSVAEAAPLLNERAVSIEAMLEEEDTSQVPAALDAYEGLIRKYPRNTTSSSEPPREQGPTTSEKNDDFLLLSQKLKSLKPEIDQALQQVPGVKGEIAKWMSQGVTAIKGKELQNAKLAIETLERVVRDALSSKSIPNNELVAQSILQRRDRVLQSLNLIREQNPAKADVLARAIDQLNKWIDQTQWETAQATLLKIEEALQKILSAAPVASAAVSSGPPNDSKTPSLQSEYDSIWQSVQSLWQRRGEQPSVSFDKIGAVIEYSESKASAGDYAKAIAALQKVLPLLQDALADAGTTARMLSDKEVEGLIDDEELGSGVVAFRKAMLIWNSAISLITSQIQTIQALATKEYPAYGLALQKLNQVLEDFNEQLSDQLDRVIQANSLEDRLFLAEPCRQTAEDYLRLVQNHTMVDIADRNPFFKVQIRSTLTSGLRQILTHLETSISEIQKNLVYSTVE